MKSLYALVLVASYGFALAQAPTIGELEKQGQRQKLLEEMEAAMKLIDDLKGKVESGSQSFALACMKSFGARSFCECINSKRPFIFSFVDYVMITSGTKEENNYEKLPKETQRAYDKVAPVRDKCVATTGSK